MVQVTTTPSLVEVGDCNVIARLLMSLRALAITCFLDCKGKPVLLVEAGLRHILHTDGSYLNVLFLNLVDGTGNNIALGVLSRHTVHDVDFKASANPSVLISAHTMNAVNYVTTCSRDDTRRSDIINGRWNTLMRRCIGICSRP